MIVRALGVLVAAWGGWFIAWSLMTWSSGPALAGAWLLACGLGLVFHARWAAWLWYGVVLAIAGEWLWAIVSVLRAAGPAANPLSTAFALVPGAILLLVGGLGGVAVARRFGHLPAPSAADR